MVLDPQDQSALRQWLQFWKSRGVSHVPRIPSESLETASVVAQSGIASGHTSQVASTVTAASAGTILPPSTDPTGIGVGQTPSGLDQAAMPLSVGSNSLAETTPSEKPLVWSLPCLSLDARTRELSELAESVKQCTRCEQLVRSRKQTVFGVGDPQAKIVFLGEAPGADEDRQGEPFVGRAGELLNKIIAASKLKREEVYIMNTLKCRPPANRTPTENEVEKCRPFFEKQLELIQPAYIVCLGVVAVRALLGGIESIGQRRGRWHAYRSAKLLVTYHPAYLLRNEDAKRLAWEDMQMLMRDLGIPIR